MIFEQLIKGWASRLHLLQELHCQSLQNSQLVILVFLLAHGTACCGPGGRRLQQWLVSSSLNWTAFESQACSICPRKNLWVTSLFLVFCWITRVLLFFSDNCCHSSSFSNWDLFFVRFQTEILFETEFLFLLEEFVEICSSICCCFLFLLLPTFLLGKRGEIMKMTKKLWIEKWTVRLIEEKYDKIANRIMLITKKQKYDVANRYRIMLTTNKKWDNDHMKN